MRRASLVALVGALGIGVACQASRPEAVERPGPIPPAVLKRFELAEGTSDSVLEPVHVLGKSTAADEEGLDSPAASIELDDVLTSVERHFPLILAAQEEIEAAEGRLLQAEGGFDTALKSSNRFELEGFYDSERLKLNLEQPTGLWGATFSGGYRLGQGTFADYEGGEKTNEDGEFKIGVNLPLLQNRAIDARRVALWRARLAREQADPVLVIKRLESTLKATDAYWKWVSAGRLREIARRLLALAESRMAQVRLAVEEGLLPRINLTENERLIVDRRVRLVRAERKLQEAGIELSLYWRDEQGRPTVPPDSLLPYEFPEPRASEEIVVPEDEAFALRHRPEVMATQLELEQLRLDRSLAQNQLQPRLDFGLFASQDIGDDVNDPDDKGPFELEALVNLDVPLQRRKAKGKDRELRAKIAKLEREFQFLVEVITTDVMDARSALTQAWLRIEQARENVRLANELADAERFQLSAGESDLLRVNLREQQAAVAAAELVEVLQAYFRSLATYRAALGIPHEETSWGPAEE